MSREMNNTTILIVDNTSKTSRGVRLLLEEAGYDVLEARDGAEAGELLSRHLCGLVFIDLTMEGSDGLELLKRIREHHPELPVVLLAASASVESAADAMRVGAIDYLTAPYGREKLLVAAERGLGFFRLAQENRMLRAAAGRSFDFSTLVTASQNMLDVLKEASLVSRSPQTTVLITGESGTGKELLAQTVHYNSARKNERFVTFNCAAVSSGPMERELFGYEEGVFARSTGTFERADGGTLFLDEITALNLEAQAEVLRVIQERQFERVGGNETVSVNVRIIAATSQNIRRLVEEGSFREDLYYRINVFPLHIPPLRERPDDIVLLADYFLSEFADRMGRPHTELSEETYRILRRQKWPGNVRELKNTIERALIISPDGIIEREHLAFLGLKPDHFILADADVELPPEGIDLQTLEAGLAAKALEITDGNHQAAARLLGLTRSRFRTLLKNIRPAAD